MSTVRENLAAHVDSAILADLRTIAQTEGREVDALVDEALADLIEKRKNGTPRPHVMAAYRASHEKYSELYKKLVE